MTPTIVEAACRTCHGLGHVEDEPCESCLGTRTDPYWRCGRCDSALRRAWPRIAYVGTPATYRCDNGHAYWRILGESRWTECTPDAQAVAP